MRKSLILFICAAFLTGCQLHTANYVRDNVFPEKMSSKLALSPILLPTYIVLSVVDIAAVNPVRGTTNVPEVTKTIWQWENKTPWLGMGVLLPVKFVGIPAAAVGTTLFSEQFSSEANTPSLDSFGR